MLKRPCSTCGKLTRDTRCEECQKAQERHRIRERSTAPKKSAQQRGYNSKWRRLSERARQLQPFCSDCGTTTDLQADHTPEAWERHDKGLEIRLQDIDVVCGACNRKRGAARGQHARSHSKPLNSLAGANTHQNAKRGAHGEIDTVGDVPSGPARRLLPWPAIPHELIETGNSREAPTNAY